MPGSLQPQQGGVTSDHIQAQLESVERELAAVQAELLALQPDARSDIGTDDGNGKHDELRAQLGNLMLELDQVLDLSQSISIYLDLS